jgi:transposase
VKQGGKSAVRVARDLDITESALRNWMKRAEIDAGKGPEGALSTAQREELRKPRKNRRTSRQKDALEAIPAIPENGLETIPGSIHFASETSLICRYLKVIIVQ